MINAKIGKVEMSGNKNLLEIEFVGIVAGLFNARIFNKKEMKQIFKKGLNTSGQVKEYEVSKEKNDEFDNLLSQIISNRKNIYKNGDEENDL